MAAVTPAQRALARWILAQEGEQGHDATGVAEAAVRAWRRLSARLEHIFTVSGCEALGRRAVFLTQDEFPFLREPGGIPSLDGVGVVFDGRDQEQVTAAAEAIYANLVGLLLGFIGEDLAMRTIRDVWPGASLRGAGEEAQR